MMEGSSSLISGVRWEQSSEEENWGSLWSGDAGTCNPHVEERTGNLEEWIFTPEAKITFESAKSHHKFILKPFNCLKFYMG